MDAETKNTNVMVIEFNEFNVALLNSAVQLDTLPALERMLNLNRSHYKTQDRYNSGYLEPWVQWVSIHTGSPSTAHHIKHLGDVPDLKQKQCWETLGDAGVSTGVWGVMNGGRNKHPNVRFFVPDPWTFTEDAFPEELNGLLELPRYIAQNYCDLKKGALFKKFLKLFKAVRKNGKTLFMIKEALKLRKGIKQFGSKPFLHICFFEYLSAVLFCEYKKKHTPQVSWLFLNSLAHLQHHMWYEGEETPTPEIRYGLKIIDKIFALLWENFPNDTFVFHNGLSQMNTNHEKPWVLYRQKDPLSFLQSLGLEPTQVEQHMTHDGHVFFDSEEARDDAFTLLSGAKIGTQKLFHVEKNEFDTQKLFYQLSFTDEIDNTATFTYNDKSYDFYTHFDKVVKRTGRHLPMGTIYSDSIHFPDHIFNHQFNQYLFNYINRLTFPLPNMEEKILEEALCDL